MNRILVVYFSLTGNTRQLAERIAERCDAQVEEIRETRPREGFLGTVRTVFQALTRRSSPIGPAVHRPQDYDLVVIGTPVWMGNLPPPVRSFLERNPAGFRNVALFCTEGASGAERVLGQMRALVGKEPVATLIVTESELKGGEFEEPFERFVTAL